MTDSANGGSASNGGGDGTVFGVLVEIMPRAVVLDPRGRALEESAQEFLDRLAPPENTPRENNSQGADVWVAPRLEKDSMRVGKLVSYQVRAVSIEDAERVAEVLALRLMHNPTVEEARVSRVFPVTPPARDEASPPPWRPRLDSNQQPTV